MTYKRSERIGVRVRPDQLEALERAAETVRKTRTELIREAALNHAAAILRETEQEDVIPLEHRLWRRA